MRTVLPNRLQFLRDIAAPRRGFLATLLAGLTSGAVAMNPPAGLGPTSDRSPPSLLDYIPAKFHAGIRDRTLSEDLSPYLQAMVDDGVSAIDLPEGVLCFRSPLIVPRSLRLIGRGQDQTTLLVSIDGYWIETRESGRRVEAQDMNIVGDLAQPRSGCFSLFDPAAHHLTRIAFRNFRREAVRLVQGVEIALTNVSAVNCGVPVKSAVTVGADGIVHWPANGLSEGTPVLLSRNGGEIIRAFFVRASNTDTFALAPAPGAPAAASAGIAAGPAQASAAPFAAIYIDPGTTASVCVTVRDCYLAAAGVAVRAGTTRGLAIENSVCESNVLGLDLRSCDGSLSDCHFEANALDGLMTDSSGFRLRGHSSTNPPERQWLHRYYGVAAFDRRAQVERVSHGSLGTTKSSSATSGRRWWDVPFDVAGPHTGCRPDLDGGVLRLDLSGDHEVDYGAVFRCEVAESFGVALRLLSAEGSSDSWSEVAASTIAGTALREGTWVEGRATLAVPPGGARVKVQAFSSVTDGQVSAPLIDGLGTLPASAYLRVRHLGTI